MDKDNRMTCLVCGKGFRNERVPIDEEQGLQLCGYYICSDCETKIVEGNCFDQGYPYYVECIKEIWDGKLGNGEDAGLER